MEISSQQFRDPEGCSLVSVEEGYEFWAESYDAGPNPLLSAEERTLKPLLPKLTGKVVLDIACGTGRWLEKLLSEGATSGAGVDFSSAMIGVAAAKPLLQGHLAKGDCLALPFRSEVADLIVCSFAVAHIGNLEVFTQELARVAKPLAPLCVSDLHPEAHASGWRTGFRHERGSVEIATLPRSLEEIHMTFQSHGLELLRCHDTHLGEVEKPIFERARKSHLFDAACAVPAVHVCQFQRSIRERVPRAALVRGAS